MSEHLTQEQISELLEDAGPDRSPAQRHVDACERCRKELERMRRMRMALSALDDVKAPAGLWSRIESRLASPARGSGDAGGGDGHGFGLPFAAVDSAWLRAAAAVLLFVGGVALGSQVGMRSGTSPDPATARQEEAARPDATGGTAAREEATAAAEGPDGGEASHVEAEAGAPARAEPSGSDPAAGGVASRGRDAASPTSGAASAGKAGRQAGPDVPAVAGSLGDPAYRRALERLGVRAPGSTPAFDDRAEAVRRLAELDGLIRASREALQADPANPAVNELLFRAMDEREVLNDALRFSALEIR